MPNTLVSSCTDLSYMQPSQDVMMAFLVFHKRRHHSHVLCEAPKKRVCTTLMNGCFWASIIFNIKKEVVKRRDFIPCFMESSQTSVEHWSKCSSWHPYISHYRTCDSWPPISDSLHFPQWDGGRRRNVRSIEGWEKGMATLCTCTGLRPHRCWQVNSVKRRNSDVSLGCLGQLETNRKSLQH